MAGRPTDCTPAVQKRILKAIKAGLGYERSAEAGGIAYTTLRQWISRGEAGEQPYMDFVNTLRAAEVEAEETLARRVIAASKTDWRSAAWILERRYSSRWGQNAGLAAELEALRRLLQERVNNDANKPRDPPTD